MPFLTSQEYCTQHEPTTPLEDCLDRLAREDAQFEKRSELVAGLCEVRGRDYCDAAIGCLSSSSEESFESCLDYARQDAERDLDAAIAWGVAATLVIVVTAFYWWRRPIARSLGKAVAWLKKTGAK